MPIELLVTSQKLLNEFKNEIGFGANTGDFTNNFTGSVMEKVKFIQELNVSWYSYSKDTSSTWNVDTTTGILTSNAGDFFVDGFAVGDTFIYEEISSMAGANFTAQITAMNSTLISFTLLSGSRTNPGDTDAMIRGTTPMTASEYRFGVIENGETFNTASKVSGNDQGYYGTNIGFDTGGGVRDTNFVNMIKLGQYKDWQTGSARIRFVSDNYNSATAQSGHQKFQIEHEFMIVPYYLDGQLSNLQNLVVPTLLSGAHSLKYVYDSSFRTVISNPNTEKKVRFENSLGDVAWFNENFSGLQNDYEILSVDYEDAVSFATASGILIGGETRIKVTVNRLSGAFVGAERYGVYISYLAEQNEYKNTIVSNLTQNFIYDRALNYAGLAGVGGDDFISDVTATINGSGHLEIEIVMEYNGGQKAFLSQKFANTPTYFMLGIEVGDNALPSGNSDRVMLLADVELYDQSPDIADLMHVTKFDIYTHEKQIGVNSGTTDVTGWNEDGLVVDFEFDLNLTLSALANSLDFVLLAHNSITNQYWNIDRYSFSPATAIVSNGVQQIIENTTRNYILKSGDQFNDVTINVGTQTAGLQKYYGRFAQKISWQEWLVNLNVDTTFFDSTEPNDNFNDKSSNYSDLSDYSIRLAILSNVDGTSPFGVSGATDYLFLSPSIKVFDYEEDGNIIPVWSCVIETFNASGIVNLGGSILTGQDTLFRATWTNSLGAVTSLDNIYGINRLEETNQSGYLITEMSSLNLPLPVNSQSLIPNVGTLLDVTIVSGDVVMECLIDGNIVLSGVNYNLSSRIHDSLPTVIEGKITESGVLKVTETSVQKIIE